VLNATIDVNMGKYSIKELEQLSGIKAHTIESGRKDITW